MSEAQVVCSHPHLELRRTNRMRPARCQTCGYELTAADVIARLLGPLETQAEQIAALALRVAALETQAGLDP